MTVKLLAAWGGQPAGTLYTSDSVTEAAMVTAGVATATLTGAVAWGPPGNSPGWIGPRSVVGFTAAQIVALAAAGTLTPNATYIASDTGQVYLARTASALASVSAPMPARPALTGIGDSLTALTYTAITISSAVRSGGVLTIVTSSAHDLYAGARCRLDGIDTFDATMRGTFSVVTRVDSTTLTVSNPGPDGTLTLGSTPRFWNLQRFNNAGLINWMQILGNQPFELKELFATSGRRTVDMPQFVPAAAATGAGYCWVLGGTNDIVLDGAGSTTVLANLRALITAVVGAGMRPLVCTIPPPIGTAYTAARAKTINQVNAGLRADCRANAGYILVDIYAALIDPVNASQGTAKTNYVQANDVHPTCRGAYYGGKRAWADITGRINAAADVRTASNADNQGFDTSSANILDAAPWTNSGGTVQAPVTGMMATGLTAFRGGSCAGVASAPARADGLGYDAMLVATPAAASDTCSIVTTAGTFHTRMVAGTPYTTLLSVSMSGLSGSTITTFDPRLVATIDGNSIQYASCGLCPIETTPLDEDFTGTIAFPPMTFTGSISAGQISAAMTFSNTGPAVTMKLGRMSIRGPVA